VVVVDALDERLDPRAFGDLFLSHLLRDLERVFLDSRNYAVAVWPILRASLFQQTHDVGQEEPQILEGRQGRAAADGEDGR